jgi:hypothetical protein
MIKAEKFSETHVKHYSDSGKKIRQIETGRIYDEAVDVVPCRFTYEETDIDAEIFIDTDNKATETDYINALEELGVNFDG